MALIMAGSVADSHSPGSASCVARAMSSVRINDHFTVSASGLNVAAGVPRHYRQAVGLKPDDAVDRLSGDQLSWPVLLFLARICVPSIALATQVPLEVNLHADTAGLGPSIYCVGLPEEPAKAIPVVAVALSYRLFVGAN